VVGLEDTNFLEANRRSSIIEQHKKKHEGHFHKSPAKPGQQQHELSSPVRKASRALNLAPKANETTNQCTEPANLELIKDYGKIHAYPTPP
jgi:hypothetical protein